MRSEPTRSCFVFGSNLAGRHGAGAALFARQHHGAQLGVGEGHTGNSYALPTKDARLRTLPLDAIQLHVCAFLDYAHQNPQLTFQLTPIGCGLAGYTPDQIAPFFVRAPSNVDLPDEFAVVLRQSKNVAPIREFRGEHRWLSNFYPAPVHHRTWVYPTVEHGFQATKTVVLREREDVAAATTPGRAKWLGRHYITLRPDWDRIRDRVMLHFVRDKFTRHPALREQLLLTGRAELVEGNTWGDQYWGVCNGCGENNLGKILMRVRTELQ